ncbi:hypothetical protein MOZ60_08040 [Stecheria sp. CLA-KB-P133]|uniref:Uncharacterized protein n=1 Tax=Grylomicrobium aquisgranensis TaxID=2926318 RepID=A0AB35U904_9FIRM|nr:hypothetical protein [Stecheria sp. CLA-KB-P133]
MRDIQIVCQKCHRVFVIDQSEQEFSSYYQNSLPKYCPICRREYARKKEIERKKQKDLEWQQKKKEDIQVYHENLKLLQEKFDIIPLKDAAPSPHDRVLYVIGNGFDLMHGVHSSYYDFGKILGKRSNIRFILDHYLQADDLWADFEGALAKIDVESMSQPAILDGFLDSMDAYDEDAQMADFYAAADMAAAPATELSSELRHRFRNWVCSLQVHSEDRPLKEIIRNGKYLDFNYTEFIETLYGVKSSDVCYIHGCRKKKKYRPKEKLILGHQPGASDAQYDFNDHWDGIDLSENHAQMIYDAQQIALQEISEADEQLTKHSDRIIAAHKNFFEGLSDINKVIVIGHSLYPVDWEYFHEILYQNNAADRINWYFSCFSNGDLERIQKFVSHFSIRKENVHIFRTDLISVSTYSENSRNAKSSEPIGKSAEEGHAVTETNSTNEKIIGESLNGSWKVCTCGKELVLKDEKDSVVLTRVFSSGMNGAVFADDQTCFLVMRGIYKGVFLLRQNNGKWIYTGELEGIPHQGVITKRLHRILIDKEMVTFVYQNRVRIYNLTNGLLIFNKAVRQASKHQYDGKDLTASFQRIYKGNFY